MKKTVLMTVFLILAAGVVIFYQNTISKTIIGAVSQEDITTISAMTDRQATFQEFSNTFEQIATDRGGEYAFELMRQAPLPFGLDTHLLGHVVGDIMYEQEGIAGMGLCQHDFRNACSHTMVVGALLEFGTGALPDIREACYDAPGGKGAYTMCFHGLGHGVFAFNDYDMDKTVQMCGELGTTDYNNREAIECFGGSVMEIIGGGGHDPELWSVQRAKYLDPDNPFALCQSDIIPEEYKPMCYNYMTPYSYEALGANMSNPGAAIFDKAFEFCAMIPEENQSERQSCYGGHGKEFIGLAVGRNFSAGARPTTDKLQLMYDWCALAEAQDGRRYCVLSTMGSLYWGGEQPYEVALEYCSIVEDEEAKSACYLEMIGNVRFYIDDPTYHQQFCADVPSEYTAECREVLSL